MSRVIIEESSPPTKWAIYGDGDLMWMGTVGSSTVDLQLVGPVDQVSRDGSFVYNGANTTGLHYGLDDENNPAVTTFPAYDGLESFEAGFYFVAWTLIAFWLLRVIMRMLASKETL